MLTRQDITKPHGQKFAPGDLVRLVKSRHGKPEGTTFRVLGSYIQRCGSMLLDSPYLPDYTPPSEDSYEYHSQFKTYDLVNVETGYSSAWYDEAELELLD